MMALQSRHACISYDRPGPLPQAAELCQSFILDNGAFAAWRKGGAVDVEGFAEWCRQWHRHPGFDWLLMPDVIDGTEDDNTRMRAKWSRVAGDLWSDSVPIWHLHESTEVLDYLCHAFGRVAIGSSGAFSEIGTTAWWGRMNQAMAVACDDDGRPRAKLHGLRMLDPTVFSAFPFASADSTNVARNAGNDARWKGAYVPTTNYVRALVLMDRIEGHASASRWHPDGSPTRNYELFG